jgi:hypothetical protein
MYVCIFVLLHIHTLWYCLLICFSFLMAIFCLQYLLPYGNMGIKPSLMGPWWLAFNGGVLTGYDVNTKNVNVFINMPVQSIQIKRIWEKKWYPSKMYLERKIMLLLTAVKIVIPHRCVHS